MSRSTNVRRSCRTSRRNGICCAGPALLALLAACGPAEEEPADRAPESNTEAVAVAHGIDPATIETRPPLVTRLLIVALDGATWKWMDPLMAAGQLPNLAGLVESGARAELTTLEPTVSPAIWTTIATGFLPERHGILGFDGVPGLSMQTLPNATMRQVKAFWEVLADFERTSATVGWWASWPAEDLGPGSRLVSDRVPYTRMEAAVERASLTSRDTHPPELIERMAPLVERPNDIDRAIVSHFLDFDDEEYRRLLEAPYEMGSFLPEFKFVLQSDRSSLRMARALLEESSYDVTTVYFTGIDTVSHLFWHFAHPDEFPNVPISAGDRRRYGAVIERYYELVDEYLGELLAASGPETTVLVVSDHGFGGTGRVPWSGGHGRLTPGAPIAPRGVLVIAGPGAAAGTTLERAHVLDVAPTVLHLMGVPASEEMLGRVLADALDPALASELPRVETLEAIGRIRSVGAFPQDLGGDAERLERLRALGYIQ